MQVLLKPMLSASLLVKTPGLAYSWIFIVFLSFFKLQSNMHVEHPKNQVEDTWFTSTSDSTGLNKLVVIPQLSSNCTKGGRLHFSWASRATSDQPHPSALLSFLRSCFTFAHTYHSLPFSRPASSPFPFKSHTPVNQPSHLPLVCGAISLYLFGNLHISPLIPR